MNKGLKIALGVAAGAAAAAGATAWLIAPGHADKKKKAPFMGVNIAHRGLHTRDKRIPENSMAAFRAAVSNGYGVEFDVHLTADKRLVVFHDDNLERMCGTDAYIDDMTYDKLAELSLAGTDERIPLLSQVLAAVDGKTPIVLELKRGADNAELCRRTHQMLEMYSGPVCIESFDPRIVRWWRKNAPEYLRGQLSAPAKSFKGMLGPFSAFALSRLLTNFISRPHFVAYGLCRRKPLTVRICEKLGAMRFCWTSHSRESERDNDAVIFEFYKPELRFSRGEKS